MGLRVVTTWTVLRYKGVGMKEETFEMSG